MVAIALAFAPIARSFRSCARGSFWISSRQQIQRMLNVSLNVGALIYTLAACALVFGLSFYYDLRDRNLYESQRRQTIFHCIRCDKLYAARSRAETCECPRCRFKNARLTF